MTYIKGRIHKLGDQQFCQEGEKLDRVQGDGGHQNQSHQVHYGVCQQEISFVRLIKCLNSENAYLKTRQIHILLKVQIVSTISFVIF